MLRYIDSSHTDSAFHKEGVTFIRDLIPLVVAVENKSLTGDEKSAVPLLNPLNELPLVLSASRASAIGRSWIEFGGQLSTSNRLTSQAWQGPLRSS